MRTLRTELDQIFGEIVIRIDSGSGFVDVRSSAIPVATLLRRGGTKAHPDTRIGCRNERDLTLRIGGTEARIAPASAGISRRSYRVDVEIHSVAYRLVPDGPGSSALSRNGRRIGRMWADHDGGAWAEWIHFRRLESNDASLVTEHIEYGDVQPTDATIGYLLAAAYGTGAPARWELLLRGLLSLG